MKTFTRAVLMFAVISTGLTSSAFAFKAASLKNAYRKLNLSAVSPKLKRLKGDARRAYYELKRWKGQAPDVVALPNAFKSKRSIASKTFAIYSHVDGSVGHNLRIFDRATQKELLRGDAVDGPYHWSQP